MASDMVVALGRATVDGHTLFGHNSGRIGNNTPCLCLSPGRQHEPGEKLRTQYVEIPQARQVFAVLGSRQSGLWGYDHGVNENQVAAGCVALPAALRCQQPGLTGPDLVRLILERSHSARQAVDLLTGLVERHGQGAFPVCPEESDHDSAFLIADGVEAYAVETAGKHWVYQEIHEVRAVSEARVVHQDWDRISCGLAGHAIAQGWWPEDGSKLDFAAALARNAAAESGSLRRWGRATLLLEEQNGHIDSMFLRRVLSDHYEDGSDALAFFGVAAGRESLCRHERGPARSATASSFVAELTAGTGRPGIAWCALAAPCLGAYFPILLDGDLPDALAQEDPRSLGASLSGRVLHLAEQLDQHPDRLGHAREHFARLQARFDQETEEFLSEAAALKQRAAQTELRRHASLFMQHNVERFDEVLSEMLKQQTWVAVEN